MYTRWSNHPAVALMYFISENIPPSKHMLSLEVLIQTPFQNSIPFHSLIQKNAWDSLMLPWQLVSEVAFNKNTVEQFVTQHKRAGALVLVPCKRSTPETIVVKEVSTDRFLFLKSLLRVEESLELVVVQNNNAWDAMTSYWTVWNQIWQCFTAHRESVRLYREFI